MRTIVTHFSPDFDAITSCWLIKKYLLGWQNSQIKFVPAGLTLNKADPDNNPDIIHVDTGLGRFDHHQNNNNTCATRLIFEFLINNGHILGKDIPALERLVDFVNQIDHFKEIFFPEPNEDRYEFMLYNIINGLKQNNDMNKVIEITFSLLEAVFILLKNKIKAEETIKKGFVFQTKWGKALAIETKNEPALKIALKQGYKLIVRRDPEKGFIRIKTQPSKKANLSGAYKEFIKLDPKASWFLHSSKNILNNGSTKNPKMKPTVLSFSKIIEILKKI